MSLKRKVSAEKREALRKSGKGMVKKTISREGKAQVKLGFNQHCMCVCAGVLPF